MKTEKYRLFVAATRNETIKAALDEAYSKASGTHVLIYTNGKRPTGFKEMKDGDLHLLPSADREWLNDVNIEIMRMFEQKHAKEAEKAGQKFLEVFAKELEKEREKLAKNGGD